MNDTTKNPGFYESYNQFNQGADALKGHWYTWSHTRQLPDGTWETIPGPVVFPDKEKNDG